MKKGLFFTLLMVSAGFLFTIQACKDKENQAPVITLAEPADGEMVMLGDSVHIEFTATDDEELHEASVIIKSHMGDTVYAEYPMVHGLKTYDYHEHYHPVDTGMFHINIAVSDHDDKTTTKEVMFHVMQ
ncbi:MAG: DUF4625 domain-containing protein [Chitinophagales bacterium]